LHRALRGPQPGHRAPGARVPRQRRARARLRRDDPVRDRRGGCGRRGRPQPPGGRGLRLMLEIDVFTLFPEAFAWLSETRPLRNATEAGQLRLRVLDLRDHALGGYRQVDDAPYGGGAGMLIRVDVVCAALESTYGAAIDQVLRDRRVAVLAPVGRDFTDAVAGELSASQRLTLLCGRYEGFDQRVHEHLANDEISIGRYVLSGGEIPAMTVVDAVCRKLPGALGK